MFAGSRFDTGGQLRFTSRDLGGQLHFWAVHNLRFMGFQSYLGFSMFFDDFLDHQKRHFYPKIFNLGGRSSSFDPFWLVSVIFDRFSSLPP